MLANKKNLMKTEKQMTLRLTKAEYDLLKTVRGKTGATGQAIIRKLLEALHEHIVTHDEITFPIHFASPYEVTKASGTIERRKLQK